MLDKAVLTSPYFKDVSKWNLSIPKELRIEIVQEPVPLSTLLPVPVKKPKGSGIKTLLIFKIYQSRLRVSVVPQCFANVPMPQSIG
jgi:hypothetical protein